MVTIACLIMIAIVLFWIAPPGVAFGGAAVAVLLLAAKLHDAVGRGRRVLAARDKDRKAEAGVRDESHRHAIFHTLWIGLTVAGTGRLHDYDHYVPGQHGSDAGGEFGGGFGEGGGGDAGGL